MENVETERQLTEQLHMLDGTIEQLKLHSFIQVMAMNGSKVVSKEEVEKNGEVCLKLREKIASALVILQDIKEKSMDKLSPHGKRIVLESIKRCQENLNGFDAIRDRMIPPKENPANENLSENNGG